jgi:hypothetical protein
MGLLQVVRRVYHQSGSVCRIVSSLSSSSSFSTAPPDLSTLPCGTVRKTPEGAGCFWYVLEPGSSQWCAQARHMQWCSLHMQCQAGRPPGFNNSYCVLQLCNPAHASFVAHPIQALGRVPPCSFYPNTLAALGQLAWCERDVMTPTSTGHPPALTAAGHGQVGGLCQVQG